ncbi:MAG: peptidylprolyl isomerase [Bryobacteraceae bacterium]|jgi:peptidyl-prolyl cis-trans isomerase C
MKAFTITNVLMMATLATAYAQTPPAQSPTPGPGKYGNSGPPPNAVASDKVTPGATAPAAAPAVKLPPDAVVLTIGDRKITRAEFESFIASLPDQYKAAASGPQRRKFAEQYADLEAMAVEARKRKIDQKPSVQQMLAIQTDQMLANQLYQDVAANTKPDDAAMKAYYEQHKNDSIEVKARHILIRFKGSAVPLKPDEKDLTPEEALAKATSLREKIVKGADFGALAKAESDDAGSGANGGDLGSFQKGRMVKEFDEAAFTLPIGEISQPVKSQFGYHIIQVESRGPQSYDQMKENIEKKLKTEMTQKTVADVKKGIPVTINDDYFGK